MTRGNGARWCDALDTGGEKIAGALQNGFERHRKRRASDETTS
jgi:hypothetical protein